MIEANTPQSVVVLDVLDHSGRLDLLAIDPYAPKNHQVQAATFDNPDQATAWIEERQGSYNLYYGANRAKRDAPRNWRLSKKHIETVRAVVADVDADKMGAGDDIAGEGMRRARAVAEEVRASSCPPTLTVFTGGGYQFVWILDPPLPATPENVDLAEGIGRTIADRYGGDSVFSIDHVFRLPGTINILSPTKREKGRKPQLVVVDDKLSGGEKTSIEALKAWAPPSVEKRRGCKGPLAEIDTDAVLYAQAIGELPPALQQKLNAALDHHPGLRALYGGETSPGDGSPSAREFELAGLLKKFGTFNVTEFAQIIGLWQFGSIRHADDLVRRAGRAWMNNPAPYGAEGFESVQISPISSTQDGGQHDAVSAWGDPGNLWESEGEPVDLPPGVVPALIDAVARDQARRLGVEPGASAVSLFTALSSLISPENVMQIRQHDPDWTVRPILWTVAIGDPASNKSATLGRAVESVRKLEDEWAAEYAAKLRLYELAHPPEESGKRKQKRKASADDEGESATEEFVSPATALTTDAAWLPEDDLPPVRRRQMVDDITSERLAELMAENRPGMLMFQDEIQGVFANMDTYRNKQGKDRALYLKLKDGASHTVDRVGGKKSIYLPCAALTILGGIQPQKLRELYAGGLHADGMLQRFLPIIVRRTGRGLDVRADDSLAQTLFDVAKLIAGCETKERFKFSPDANVEYLKLEDFKDAELASSTTDVRKQWVGKSANLFGALALVFHFIEHYNADKTGTPPPVVVSANTARMARRFLIRYAYPHATAVYSQILGVSETETHAQWIAGFILSHQNKFANAPITERDVYRNYRSVDKKQGYVSQVMRVLELQDWVKPVRFRADSATAWRVNPVVFQKFSSRAEQEIERRAAVKSVIKMAASARAADNVTLTFESAA